ncbi:unnamed protein product [Protopolystoma xenopodis]|uniref:Uncharacterized protein n=1 Tax=Protopolystoma xenopodis TaxID=117903 RepID=A0A448WM34_9PLAT|nr:unnamed protein product [Protopolystoma xenopodis]
MARLRVFEQKKFNLSRALTIRLLLSCIGSASHVIKSANIGYYAFEVFLGVAQAASLAAVCMCELAYYFSSVVTGAHGKRDPPAGKLKFPP